MHGSPVQTDRQQQPQPVVVVVAEAVSDALDLLDEHVHGFGRAVARRAPSGGGERGEQLGLPGVQGAGETPEVGGFGAGAAVQNFLEPMLGVGEVVAALVEQHQLLGDHRGVGELAGRVTEDAGVLEFGPLPLVEGGERPAEQPPSGMCLTRKRA